MHCSLKRSETGLSFRKPLPVLFFLSGIRDRVLGSKFKFGGRQGGGGEPDTTTSSDCAGELVLPSSD